MKRYTLAYIKNEDKVLMIHRVKKKDDVNEGKWIGIGGKIEENETIYDSLIRETKEETNLTIGDYTFLGIIKFYYYKNDISNEELIYAYNLFGCQGEFRPNEEGIFEWINNNKVKYLELWDGDRYFIGEMLENKYFGTYEFYYQDDILTKAVKNEEIIYQR